VTRQFSHSTLELLRTAAGTSCLILIALVTVGFGVWVIVGRGFPGWMRGPLRWPYPDVVKPAIALMCGWACVASGVGLMVVTLGMRQAGTGFPLALVSLAGVLAVASALLLVLSYIWSRRTARLDPNQPA
jgi:hypothetical protein